MNPSKSIIGRSLWMGIALIGWLGACKIVAPLDDVFDEAMMSFEAGDYQGAAVQFQGVVQQDAAFAEALCGLGLCQAKLDRLDQATRTLEQAMRLNAALVDIHGGLAIVYSAHNRDEEAIEEGEIALRLIQNGASILFHPVVTERAVRIVLMHSYFYVGRWADAQHVAERLTGEHLEDHRTEDQWIIGGRTYNTYEAALLAFVEQASEVEM